MKLDRVWMVLGLGLSLLPLTVAQTPSQTGTLTGSSLPRLVRFAGTVKELSGAPQSGVVGITFELYSEQSGGAPLWVETQNVTADDAGHYTVLLGATKPDGLPAELFTSEQARWVGVQVSGQTEQSRVLLVSAPYALKAGDAETIGGLPPSAFMLATPGSKPGSSTAVNAFISSAPPTAPGVTGSGVADYVPLWTSSSALADSILFQSGSGSTAKIGINSITPAATLDVNGGATIRGLLNLPAAANATAQAGADSRPFGLVASTFNSGTATSVNQAFHWQAEPAGNNTAAPSATLNLLFATAPAVPAETGLHIASNGQITFAPGQTFPGAVSAVTSGNLAETVGGNFSDSIGGSLTETAGSTMSLTSNSTMSLKAPLLNVAANETVIGSITATGQIQGGVINATTGFDIGGTPFDFGNAVAGNSFLGFAGNSTMTGTENIGVGFQTLGVNTIGNESTGVGFRALFAQTTGDFNTAVGGGALDSVIGGSDNTAVGTAAGRNTTGSGNTAVGFEALFGNSSGSFNTALGYLAQPGATNLTNATAIGANSVVSESNALVLGGTGANAVEVGIGTTTPGFTLDVNGAGNFSAGVNGVTNIVGAYGVFGTNTANSGVGTNGVFGSTSSPAGGGVVGVNFAASGNGIYGQTNGTTGASAGVYGIAIESSATASTYGVYGTTSSPKAGSAGVYGVAAATPSDVPVYGVYGLSNDNAFGAAVAGTGSTISSLGADYQGGGSGVWGDVANGACCYGILGTADDGDAILAINNSGSNTFTPALTAVNNTTTSNAVIFEAESLAGGSCSISVEGNLTCTGTVTPTVQTTAGREVKLYSVASPENWFEDFGSASLSNGVATINLDATFAGSVSASSQYHVFLTPKGDCEGLYVSHESAGGFEVHEMHGGRSSVEFDYRIVAKRRGYETVRMEDVTDQMTKMRQRQAQLQSRTHPGMTSAPARPVPMELSPKVPSQARPAHTTERAEVQAQPAILNPMLPLPRTTKQVPYK